MNQAHHMATAVPRPPTRAGPTQRANVALWGSVGVWWFMGCVRMRFAVGAR